MTFVRYFSTLFLSETQNFGKISKRPLRNEVFVQISCPEKHLQTAAFEEVIVITNGKLEIIFTKSFIEIGHLEIAASASRYRHQHQVPYSNINILLYAILTTFRVETSCIYFNQCNQELVIC